MKMNMFRYLLVCAVIVCEGSTLMAGLVGVNGGSLQVTYDGAAFANTANLDQANWGFVTPTAGQDLIRFGRWWAPSQTIGPAPNYAFLPGGTTAYRPLQGTGPAPRQPNFRDNRAFLDPLYPVTSPILDYGVNANANVPLSVGRNRTATTLTFDTSNPLATMNGGVETNGVAAWWFANDAIINAGNVAWVSFGDLQLRYDASRVTAGYSGWIFANQLGGFGDIFDTNNVTFTSNGSTLQVSGDLYGNDSGILGFYVGLEPGVKYGSFAFTGNLSAIPEPTSMALVAMAGVSALGVRRWRRKTNSTPSSSVC